MAFGIDAEDVAALCILAADGDLSISCADVADLLEATERRARASFGPVPGDIRRALAGLVLESGLAYPEELRRGTIDDVLARLRLRNLLGPILSRDRLWFDAGGGVHWTSVAPAELAAPGGRARTELLVELAVVAPGPVEVLAALAALGWSRSFVKTLLERAPRLDDDEVRRQVAFEDWYE
ncbi:MAG: hypothetical protein GXY82_05425 [Methanospirillum sp.]|nr:hypothetical protein [Methanospirillum sp.]